VFQGFEEGVDGSLSSNDDDKEDHSCHPNKHTEQKWHGLSISHTEKETN